jgi:hypothetical protein
MFQVFEITKSGKFSLGTFAKVEEAFAVKSRKEQVSRALGLGLVYEVVKL